MRTPLTTAFLNPLNLTMLVLAVLAGLLAAWWLLPLGIILWAIMVAMIAKNPSVEINYNLQARMDTLSARFQGLYSKVVSSQTRIFNLVLGANGRMKRALAPVQTEVENLVNEVYELCQRMNAPENYVKTSQANTDYTGQRALLVLSLKGVTDPVVKREKEEALKSLDESIQKIKNIAALLDRVDAQISGVVTAMDAVLADIMRLQVLGATQTEKEIPGIVQKIRLEIDQLRAFEKEAASLL
jgi:hypothetical protein